MIILSVLVACCDDESWSFVDSKSAPVPAPESVQFFTYGVHGSNGTAAVEFFHGPEGMWLDPPTIEYQWNRSRFSAFGGA